MRFLHAAYTAGSILAMCAGSLFTGCSKSDRDSKAAPPRADETGPAAAPASAAASAAKPSDAAGDGSATPPKRPEKPLNVLLILVDSMRADMPWAGYPRDIAPNLTALEKQSVSYTRGYSVSSYTAKSVGALLGGKYPSTMFRSGVFFTRYPQANLMFPELLEQGGVHTIGSHAHMYMNRANGMEQGFVDWQVVKGLTFDAQTDNHVTSDKMTAMIIEQLAKVPAGKPFFVYAHYMDPHDQYVKHKESPDFGNKTRDKYDNEMFYTDLHIGKLFEHCRAQPWWKDTAVIISADHGEAFGEHGMYRHAFELWNVLTHVPLFFHVPGAPPRRIDTPRSAIDIAPTVLDLMQVKAEHDFVGKTLIGELFGEPAEPRPVLLDLPADSNNSERHALIDGDYKLLVYGNSQRFELYNLKTDPGELTNLAKTEPDKLEQLKEQFKKLWSELKVIKPYGGNQLKGGGTANGPSK